MGPTIQSVVAVFLATLFVASARSSCDAAQPSDTSRATIERRARDVLASDRYQTELVDPSDATELDDSDPDRDHEATPAGERRSRRVGEGQGRSSVDLGWVSGFAPIIVVVVCAAIALFVVYLLTNSQWRRRGNAVARNPDAKETPVEDVSIRALEDPDRLAADGRFDAAIHAAMLHAIDRVSSRVDCGAARTTREILADRELDSSVRDPFGRIALECERTLFGGRSAAEEDYSRARSALEAIPVSTADD